MKSLILIPFILVLSGCELFQRQPTAVEYRYVVRKAPAELYDVPKFPKLEVTEATLQSDIAIWITEVDERSRELENKILKLKEFFEAPVEQPKKNPETETK
jgi:hypothetical protein